MNLVKEIEKEIEALPEDLVLEAWDFIRFLKYKTYIKNIPETMLLSEKSLAKEWLTPEEDEVWKDL